MSTEKSLSKRGESIAELSIAPFPRQVHQERYVAPYNGGAELAGCGGGMSPFAQKASLSAEDVRQLAHRASTITNSVTIACDGVETVRSHPSDLALR